MRALPAIAATTVPAAKPTSPMLALVRSAKQTRRLIDLRPVLPTGPRRRPSWVAELRGRYARCRLRALRGRSGSAGGRRARGGGGARPPPVIPGAVDPVVHRILDAATDRLEQRERDEGRSRHRERLA